MSIRLALLMLALGGGIPLIAQPGTPLKISGGDTEDGEGQILKVQNMTSATITAFAYTFDFQIPTPGKQLKGTGTIFYDAATEPMMAKPLSENQEELLPIQLPSNIDPDAGQLRAVLYADGTSWGDSIWMRRILERRKIMERYLRKAIADLEIAQKENASLKQLVDGFQAAFDRDKAKAKDDPDETTCISSTYGIIVKNLQELNRNNDGTALILGELLKHQSMDLKERLSNLLSFSSAP